MNKKEKWEILLASAIKSMRETADRFQDQDMNVEELMIETTLLRFFKNEEIANDNCIILDKYSQNGMEKNYQKKFKK